MHPNLIDFSFFSISSGQFFALLALAVFILCLIILAPKNRLKLHILNISLIPSLIMGIIVGRLFYILSDLNYYFFDFSLASIYRAIAVFQDLNISFWGFIVGSLGYFFINAYKKHENIKKWADLCSIALLFALSILAIGSFLEGSAYGRPTNLFWGIRMTNPLVKYTSEIHPTQIFAFLYCLIIGLKTLNMRSHKDGHKALYALFYFSIFKFIESLFRGDELLRFWIFRTDTILSLIASYILYKKMQTEKLLKK